MKNDQFQPGEVTVTPNTKVVWVNRDQHNHTVVSGNPSSNTGGSGY
jgi:plastocyanin